MAVSDQTQQLLRRSSSFSFDAIKTTNYADDYTVRGNNYVFSNVIDLAGGATVNFLLDLSSVPSTDGMFILPFAIASSAECCFKNMVDSIINVINTKELT